MTALEQTAIDFAWIKLNAYLEAKQSCNIELTHWDEMVKAACDYLYPHSFRAEFDQRLQRAKEAKQ
jgi:hypothetical protein